MRTLKALVSLYNSGDSIQLRDGSNFRKNTMSTHIVDIPIDFFDGDKLLKFLYTEVLGADIRVATRATVVTISAISFLEALPYTLSNFTTSTTKEFLNSVRGIIQ